MSRNLEIRIRLDAAEKRKLERDARKRKMTVAQHVRTLAGLEEAKRGRKPGGTPIVTTPAVEPEPPAPPSPDSALTEPPPALVPLAARIADRADELQRQGRSAAVAFAEARAEYARERP